MLRTREQVVWDFVQEWMHKAESDLRAAEHLLNLDQEDYFTSAFHAQQASEKLLKAFLVRHQIRFGKTHDIHELLHWQESLAFRFCRSWRRLKYSRALALSSVILATAR